MVTAKQLLTGGEYHDTIVRPVLSGAEAGALLYAISIGERLGLLQTAAYGLGDDLPLLRSFLVHWQAVQAKIGFAVADVMDEPANAEWFITELARIDRDRAELEDQNG